MNYAETYWLERYATGGNSGPGSKGRLAEFKATTMRDLVRVYHLKSIGDFGCGAG